MCLVIKSFLEMQHIDQVSQALKTDKNIRADKFCQETFKIWNTEYDKIGEHYRFFKHFLKSFIRLLIIFCIIRRFSIAHTQVRRYTILISPDETIIGDDTTIVEATICRMDDDDAWCDRSDNDLLTSIRR